jgi:hypothetical protein
MRLAFGVGAHPGGKAAIPGIALRFRWHESQSKPSIFTVPSVIGILVSMVGSENKRNFGLAILYLHPLDKFLEVHLILDPHEALMYPDASSGFNRKHFAANT